MISAQPINNKWYRYYNKSGATSLTSVVDCSDYFTVYKKNSNGYRNYAAFRDIVDFFYHLQNHERIREYHEMIPGNKPQKPRFDIDLTTESAMGENLYQLGIKIRDGILRGVERIISEIGFPIDINKDVGVYTAHSEDVNDVEATNAKFSCHIILHSFCHQNYEEAQEFCKLVVVASEDEDVAMAYKKGIIDPSVYKSLCSLRMLYSVKDEKRPKVPLFRYQYGDRIIDWTRDIRDVIALRNLFQDSAVTYVSECTILPIMVPEKQKKHVNLNLPEGTELRIGEMLTQSEGDIFEIEEFRGTLVILKRLSPSYCDICNRNHGDKKNGDVGDNPYLTISPNGAVRFHCRRDKNKSGKVIGYLNGVTSEQGAQVVTPTSFMQIESEIEPGAEPQIQAKQHQIGISMMDKILPNQILSNLRTQPVNDEISFSNISISNVQHLNEQKYSCELSFGQVMNRLNSRVQLPK